MAKKNKPTTPAETPAVELTWEDYQRRDQEDYDAARPFLVANDLDGAAANIFSRQGRGGYCWVDDHFNRMTNGTTTRVTRSKLIDAVQGLEYKQDRVDMEAHNDVVVLQAIADKMGIGVLSPRDVRERIDFKVMTRAGRKLVRLGGFYMECVADDKGEFPPKVAVAEIIRVLKELGAKETKREKRPGRPTGYDGWAW